MLEGLRSRLAAFIAPPRPARARGVSVGARVVTDAVRRGIQSESRGSSREWESLPDENGLIHGLMTARADHVARARWTVYRVPRGVPTQRRRAVLGEIRRQSSGEIRRLTVEAAIGRGELEAANGHPGESVIHGFDGLLTGYARMRSTAVLLSSCGEAYWLLGRGRHGTPTRSYLVPASWLVASSRSHMLFRSPTTGRPIRVRRSDVVHLVHPLPTDPYTETSSTLEAMAHEIEAVEQMAEKLATTIATGGRPELLISGPGVTDDEEFDDRWRDAALDELPLRLDVEPDELGGGIHVEQFGYNAEEQQIKPLDELLSRKVLAGGRTPLSVLGDYSGVTDPLMARHIDRQWKRDVVEGDLWALRELFEAGFMDQYRGFRDWAVLEYSDPAAPDRTELVQAYQRAPMAPSVAEWRALQYLPFEPGTHVHHLKGRMWRRLDDPELVGPVPPPPTASSALADLPLRSDP